MDNEGRLFSQVAAEAGVPAEKAMVACYLLNLSRQGKTLDEAATLLRKRRCEARDYARDWGISFTDYKPARKPLVLKWTKPRRGRWELIVGDALVAAADSDGQGGYTACAEAASIREVGSSAEVAIRRASIELERRSVEIFGVDDVEIRMVSDGCHDVMAPKSPADTAKLRSALGS
jgi:hypothetical protein